MTQTTEASSLESTGPTPTDSDAFWGHAAAFGALWGAVEATLGSYLHALRIPFSGALLASIGASILIALRVAHPKRGVVVAAGVVASIVKLISPATVILGPIVGILVESLLVELACGFGANPFTAPFAGGLAALWALCQKVLTQVVLFGAPMLDLYKELLKRGTEWLGAGRDTGVRIVFVVCAVVFVMGASFAVWGLACGRAALRTVRV